MASSGFNPLTLKTSSSALYRHETRKLLKMLQVCGVLIYPFTLIANLYFSHYSTIFQRIPGFSKNAECRIYAAKSHGCLHYKKIDYVISFTLISASMRPLPIFPANRVRGPGAARVAGSLTGCLYKNKTKKCKLH